MRLEIIIALVGVALWPGGSAEAGELAGGWNSRTPGVSALLVSVSFADDQVGWACGLNAITRTVNGGKTWRAQTPPSDTKAYWFNNVVALSPQVAMVSGFPYGRPGPGLVLRTADAGETWKPVPVGSAPDAAFTSLVFAADRRTGYVLSTREGLFTTTDGGLTWKPVALPGEVRNVWVATRGTVACPSQKAVRVAGQGAVFASDDGGATWQKWALPASVGGNAAMWITFPTPDRGWVSYLGNNDFATRDGGRTWEQSQAPGRPVFADAQHGWALGQYDIAGTDDGGVTWTDSTRLGGGLDALVAATMTGKRVVVVGGAEAYGRAFLADRLLPGVRDEAAPAGVVPITFTMPQAGYATIQILDERNQVVQNVVAGQAFPAGSQTVWWDLSTLDDFWPPFTRSRPWLYAPPADARTVAEPGHYHWRGLWHTGLPLTYRFSYYPLKQHGLAWITPDKTGGWLGDHAPPQDVIRTGDTMWVGTFCESGDALLEADLDMRKLWGSNRIELACPRVLATAGDFVYYVDQGGWLGSAGQRITMIQVNAKTKAARRFMTVQQGQQEDALKSVEGLAVIGSRAYLADREQNAVVVCNIADNLAGKSEAMQVVQRIPLARPGRLRPYDDQRLAAVCRDGVALLSLDTGAVTPVVTGLTNPLGLAVDGQGRFYVGEMDPVHQVKVFSSAGKLVRTIGKPGKHQVGPFDADNLESPAGLEVDARGNVWVCEFSEEMKRTSVWSPSGHCLNQVIGPTIYGGAGDIDPEDENHLFYRGQEFHRDPQTGAVRLTNLMWRQDDTRYDHFVESRPQNFGGPAPAYPFWHGGKLFFRMWGGWGMGEVTTLFVYDQDHVRPVAAVGTIPGWLRERLGPKAVGKQSFAWTDLHGEGKVRSEEVQVGNVTGSAIWGVRMNEDFSVAFSTVVGDVGLCFFRPARLTAQGYPVYALPTEMKMVPNLRVADPSQVQAVMCDQQGNGIALSPYLFSMTPDGVVNWRYKCRWPGLHAGLSATATGTEPGVLVAPLRFYGSGLVNPEVGEVVCVGGNYGTTDLFTADGLYIGRAFGDSRRSDAWAFDSPPTPAQLAKVSLGQEHFGGTFQRVKGADGRYHFLYVVAGGGPSCSVVEQGGLESIHRLAGGQLEVTAEHWAQAERLRQQRAAEVMEPATYTIRRMAPFTVDGKADKWPAERVNGFALGYDDRNLYVLYQGSEDRGRFQNAATPDNFMDAFKKGGVVDVMLATKPGADPKRGDAGEGDLRLSFALVGGQPQAILYDYVVPGTPATARVPFSSPWQTTWVDRVTLLPQAQVVVTHNGSNYTLEAAVPLAAIHLDPRATPTLRGDVGIVRSDQTGTRSVDRVYWSNQNTRTMADLAFEARLQPNLWGTFTFESKP